MFRSVILAGVSTCVIVVAAGLTQSSNVQAQMVAANGDCWINSMTGTPVPRTDLGPFGSQLNDPRDPNHASIPSGPTVHGPSFVRIPCPPTNASTTPPMQSSTLPGGTLLPGKDAGGHDTPDKPGGGTKTTDTKPTDAKTTDTKPTDTKTPGAPVKDDKPQQADTPKTGQTEKSVTGKDDKPSKTTASKDNPRTTKHLTGPANASKTATAPKTAKTAAAKPKEKKPEDKTQIHIEIFSTGGGRMGGGGFGR